MIDRYDPFGRGFGLRQAMDRLLEDAFVLPREGGQAGSSSAALNVYEEGDNLVVEAPLPGVKPEDVDISVEQGTLTIRAQSTAEQERRDRNYLVREYRAGSLARSVGLPPTVDPDACEATFDQGVLRLVFPRSEQSKPRRIQLRGSGGPQSLDAARHPEAGASGVAQGASTSGAQNVGEQSGRTKAGTR